jgi:hypothetical protein
LGAKIALAIVLSLGATAIWGLSLWKFFDGRRNPIKLCLAGLFGCGLIGLIAIAWGWGGS